MSCIFFQKKYMFEEKERKQKKEGRKGEIEEGESEK